MQLLNRTEDMLKQLTNNIDDNQITHAFLDPLRYEIQHTTLAVRRISVRK